MVENKLIWIKEEEQNKELEDRKAKREPEDSADGYIKCAEGLFRYKGVAYLIKVLRYFNIRDGFKPINPSRISDKHVVVEYPKETEDIKSFVDEIDEYSEFLCHDTLHSFNDKQTVENQIKECHKLAKYDIDRIQSLPKKFKSAKELNEAIDKGIIKEGETVILDERDEEVRRRY